MTTTPETPAAFATAFNIIVDTIGDLDKSIPESDDRRAALAGVLVAATTFAYFMAPSPKHAEKLIGWAQRVAKKEAEKEPSQ